MSYREYTDADKVILKECYTLAESFTSLAEEKSVISAKSRALGVSREQMDVFADTAYENTEMAIISGIIDGLSRQALDDRTAGGQAGMEYELGNMPEGPEREYVYALLALRYDRGNQARADALRHLTTALSYDSNDPRYLALLEVLDQAGAR